MKTNLRNEKMMSYDLAVVGAGLSGICAAIAAARLNLKVVLIGNRSVLGGNSSSEIRVWTRGATGGGNLFAEEAGILGELKNENEYKNSEGNPVLWDEILFDKVLAEENITLLLNTQVVALDNNNDIILSINAIELNTDNIYQIFASYFVDATGDGFLAATSGLEYVMGKESDSKYNEKDAPKVEEKSTQGCSILMRTSISDHSIPFVAPSYVYSLEKIENILGKGGRIVNEKSNGCDFWWVEYGGQLNVLTDMSQITLELKKLAYGIFNYIKNSGKFEASNLVLEWMGTVPGKRESRRFITEYVLNSNDIFNKHHFVDAVFYGGWYLDFHPSNGIYSEQEFCTQIPVEVYEIPLRTLYNTKVSNLLLCGRIIGASHSAFASTRVMNTCALSGQAAGTAVAVLCKNGLTNKALLNQEYSKEVQRQLAFEDSFIPNVKLNNLSKPILFSTFDNLKKLSTTKLGELPVTEDFFLCVPNIIANKINYKIYASTATNLIYSTNFSALPSRKIKGNGNITTTIKLHEGENTIKLLSFSDKEAYIIYRFENNYDVKFSETESNSTQIVMGNNSSAKLYYPLIECEDLSYFGISNLNNGYTRPCNNSNCCILEGKQAVIKGSFFTSIEPISRIDLFFDNDLASEMLSTKVPEVNRHHAINFRTSICPRLVKSFELVVLNDDVVVKVINVDFNVQRHVKLCFEEVFATGIILKIKDTHGSNNPGVFDIWIN